MIVKAVYHFGLVAAAKGFQREGRSMQSEFAVEYMNEGEQKFVWIGEDYVRAYLTLEPAVPEKNIPGRFLAKLCGVDRKLTPSVHFYVAVGKCDSLH